MGYISGFSLSIDTDEKDRETGVGLLQCLLPRCSLVYIYVFLSFFLSFFFRHTKESIETVFLLYFVVVVVVCNLEPILDYTYSIE